MWCGGNFSDSPDPGSIGDSSIAHQYISFAGKMDGPETFRRKFGSTVSIHDE